MLIDVSWEMSFIMLWQIPYLPNLFCYYRVEMLDFIKFTFYINWRTNSVMCLLFHWHGLYLILLMKLITVMNTTWSWWIIILIYDWINFLVFCENFAVSICCCYFLLNWSLSYSDLVYIMYFFWVIINDFLYKW